MLKKFMTGLTVGSLMLSVVAPAMAGSRVFRKGDYKKTPTVKKTNLLFVHQGSSTNAWVGVGQEGETGENKVEDNTGKKHSEDSVTVDTGNVTNKAEVTVEGGSNTFDANPCGCEGQTQKVWVKGEGEYSHNKVGVEVTNVVSVSQHNSTNAWVSVYQEGETGENKVEDNTGVGDVSVTTGNVSNTATVTVVGGSNEATL